MRKQNFQLFFYSLLIAGCSLLLACNSLPEQKVTPATKVVTDALGRKLTVPTTLKKIYPLRAGTLRLLCYLQLAEKVAYVELNEKKRTVPYLMAYPDLKELPVLGVGNNVDPEHLAASDVEIVIATYMSAQEADALQNKSGKPVFVVSYGDLVDLKKEFYAALKSIGDLTGKSGRADSLIGFIEENLVELKSRVPQNQSKNTVYVGGVAYNGSQGITSTRVRYPPFYYLNLTTPVDAISNAAMAIGAGQKNSLLDIEQILIWNPTYIFLDAAGKDIWQQELKKPAIRRLTALQSGKTFSLLPFNWHTINYENLLCNTWFVGKTVYPETFAEVNIEKKSAEIISYFYGTNIFDEIKETYHPFVSYTSENYK